MKKVQLLLLTAGALLLAACAESSTGPSQMQTKGNSAKPAFDFTCSSGYVVAFDQDGNPYCAPASGETTAAASSTLRRP